MTTSLRISAPLLVRSHRARRVFGRNVVAFRRGQWQAVLSGFFEPLFYLWSIGIGIGHLVGAVDDGGHVIRYAAYVAPGLLATSAMNGAVLDSTLNIFWKLKYQKIYDVALATPITVADVVVGEIGWALFRGEIYAATFVAVMAVMGLVTSWWTLLVLPAAALVGFAFAAVGMGLTSYMRSWVDFELVSLCVTPMFLFSATFYPLGTFPRGVQLVIEALPLYHGVALLRAFTTGRVHLDLIGHSLYFVVMGLTGLAVATRRLGRLLQP
jgi:lipooligosaccharide transport system permease protein